MRIDDRAHQLAARRSALRRHPAGRGEAGGDQAFCAIDEIVEGVDALLELAVEEPAMAEVVAAADMGDRAGIAAVEQADTTGRESWRNGDTIGAIAVEIEPAAAVLGEP